MLSSGSPVSSTVIASNDRQVSAAYFLRTPSPGAAAGTPALPRARGGRGRAEGRCGGEADRGRGGGGCGEQPEGGTTSAHG